MSDRKTQFKSGAADGIPIGVGYLAVSFTFGIMAGSAGLSIFDATLLSFYERDKCRSVRRTGSDSGRASSFCGNGFDTAYRKPQATV